MGPLRFLGIIGLIASLIYLPMEYCVSSSCNFFAWDWIWSKPKWGEQISVIRTLLQVSVSITFLIGVYFFETKGFDSKSKNQQLKKLTVLPDSISNRGEIPAPQLGFQEAVLNGIKNWKTFHGRASRSEFFYFSPLVLLIIFSSKFTWIYFSELLGSFGFVIVVIVSSIALIGLLSVTVRRLKDIKRSEAWALLWLTTIGAPMLVAMLCEKGKSSGERSTWTSLAESILIAAAFWLIIYIVISLKP